MDVPGEAIDTTPGVRTLVGVPRGGRASDVGVATADTLVGVPRGGRASVGGVPVDGVPVGGVPVGDTLVGVPRAGRASCRGVPRSVPLRGVPRGRRASRGVAFAITTTGSASRRGASVTASTPECFAPETIR